MKTYAPIALFVYNRPLHVKNVIKALKINYLASLSQLIIFSDGPKNIDDYHKVNEVRTYLRKIRGFKKIMIIERKKNFGLSKNIISGVTTVLNKYKKIIVLEDDLVVNKNFLKFMNSGLEIYKKNKNIASIHGYVYPIKNLKDKINGNYFFLKGADCWGWATWNKSWKKFQSNGKSLLKKIQKKKLIKEFNFNNSFDYYKMLNDQTKNKNDSWAVRWYASAFINDMLTLYPVYSYVKNIGIDKSGINSKLDLLNLGNKKNIIKNFNIKKQKIVESKIGREQFEFFFKSKKFYKIKMILKNFLDV